jgi:hypothetical protein
MNVNFSRGIFAYVFIFFCFFVDLTFACLFKERLVESLLCFMIAINIYFEESYITLGLRPKESSWVLKTALILVLLSFESLIFYGRFGLDIGLLIVLALLVRKVSTMFPNPYLISGSLVLLYLLFKKIFIETILLGLNFSFKYTFFYIFVNILIVSFFLKFLVKGKRGNRVL